METQQSLHTIWHGVISSQLKHPAASSFRQKLAVKPHRSPHSSSGKAKHHRHLRPKETNLVCDLTEAPLPQRILARHQQKSIVVLAYPLAMNILFQKEHWE